MNWVHALSGYIVRKERLSRAYIKLLAASTSQEAVHHKDHHIAWLHGIITSVRRKEEETEHAVRKAPICVYIAHRFSWVHVQEHHMITLCV